MENSLETKLYNFNNLTCFYDWIVTTDKDIGGESTGQIYFEEQE